MDFIVPHRANRPRRMRVRTFCVERGRWDHCRMGEEPTNTFKSATHMAPSRDLKLSIRRESSQKAVWSSVDAAHSQAERAASAARMSVRPLSPSSLPLADGKRSPSAASLATYLIPVCQPARLRIPMRSASPSRSTAASAAPICTPRRNFSSSSGRSCLETAALEALTEVRYAHGVDLRRAHPRGGFGLAAPFAPWAVRRGTLSPRA